jgi:cyanophycinase-like exopeptidase
MTGYIFAIGGGKNIDLNIFKRILEKSNNNNVLLITDASTYALSNHVSKTMVYFNSFENINVTTVRLNNIKILSELINKIYSNGVIYFTGGHQTHLLQQINKFNKKFNIELKVLLSQYLISGGVVSGTSAGASILGLVMPTGKNIGKRSNNYYVKQQKIPNKIQKVERALGLVPYIIDQHFTENKRHKRGMGMAIDNRMKVVGIDENTCIYQKFNSNRLYKQGPNKITIYNGTTARFTMNGNNIYVSNI